MIPPNNLDNIYLPPKLKPMQMVIKGLFYPNCALMNNPRKPEKKVVRVKIGK